jgi:glycosyltransferase involved in cell wall biosynthesis
MMLLPLSVVICSRNRAKSLDSVLNSWAALLEHPGWDLLVVDDGSDDDTPRTLDAHRARFGPRLRVERTGGVGLGAARNVGWRAATVELILFTDDDCYPAPDLMDRIRECFAESELAFLGGRLLPHRPEDAEVATVTRAQRVEVVGPCFVPAGLLPGANLTIRRTALLQAGGFDPRFGAGTPFAAEDVELVARLASLGLPGAFDPRPVVYHHHGRRTEASVAGLRRSYDWGRGAYYAKCLGNPLLRSIYLRAWGRSLATGSWRRAGRELVGAWRYWRGQGT